jgi:SOS-response transcriptional repressor LexA
MGIPEMRAQGRAIHSLGAKIRARRRDIGLTLQDVADRAGCTKGYLSSIENDKRQRPPSDTVLSALERALELTPGELTRAAHWQSAPPDVRAEAGELQARSKLGERLAELIRAKGIDDAYASGELQSLVDRLARASGAPDLAPAPLPVQVPLINKVAAGYPTEFTDLGYPARIADEYISTPDIHDPDAFAARVVGDSMAPEYREGDIVVFSPERDTPEGSDCFVRFDRDEETTFKRIYFETDADGRERIRLQPLNSAYPPRSIPREDVAGMYAAVYVVRRAGGG